MNTKLKLIIKREFNAKVRNKSFIIMTILAPFIIVGMGFLIVYLSNVNDNVAKTVAYVDGNNLFKNNPLTNTETISYLDLTNLGIEEAKKQSKENKYYGLLIIPKNDSIELLAKEIEFFSEKSPNLMFVKSLEDKVENNLRNIKLKSLGIDREKIKSAKIKSNFKLATYEGEKSSKMLNGAKIGLGSLGGYLLMMFIIVYGTSVMRSVIEEKTSRIIEVIISSVKPFQLMMGKIIGNALAGLTQFAIWGIMITILSLIVLPMLGSGMSEVPQGNMSPEQLEMMTEVSKNGFDKISEIISQLPLGLMGILFIVYFLGGYLLYSSLFAAIGAAVDSETDTQQFMMPIMMPLMIGVYVGAITVIKDPHGPIATIFSMIPLTSPIVMPMRVPFNPPMWQIILSVLILIGSFIFMVWFAAKIYRVGILMYGKKPTYKELFKWLKY